MEFTFDEQKADRADAFLRENVQHVKGEWAGRPFVPLPWQSERIIRPLFGWQRPDGTRRYRSCFVAIPRKNGKSTLAAPIALLLLFADREAGAEVYSAAADRFQAAIVFDMAKQMVEASPALRKRCRIFKRSIEVPATGSVYHVLSADAATKHGLNASGIIFDELHAQPSRELWDVLTTSTGARRQPIVFAITTAGYGRESICREVWDYALKVRDGIVEDDAFLPVIFAADPAADWREQATWAAANPSLGATIKPEYLEQECARAREVPAYENTFKRLHLNLWTEADSRWLNSEAWDACAGAVDAEALVGRECYAGLDLSTTTDLSALALFFPAHGDEPAQVLPFFWVPEDGMAERVRRDRVPYDVWARQGHIEATSGNVVDYDLIRQRLHELAARYQIREVGYDPWNATQLATQLLADGVPMVPVRQGFGSLTGPTKELERLVTGRALAHGGHPVLRWCANNVTVTQDAAGNVKPDKGKSTERIDGVVALIIAISRALVCGGESAWDGKVQWLA